MGYTINCIVLGEEAIFQVDINEALSVYKLKMEIKNEKSTTSTLLSTHSIESRSINTMISRNATMNLNDHPGA